MDQSDITADTPTPATGDLDQSEVTADTPTPATGEGEQEDEDAATDIVHLRQPRGPPGQLEVVAVNFSGRAQRRLARHAARARVRGRGALGTLLVEECVDVEDEAAGRATGGSVGSSAGPGRAAASAGSRARRGSARALFREAAQRAHGEQLDVSSGDEAEESAAAASSSAAAPPTLSSAASAAASTAARNAASSAASLNAARVATHSQANVECHACGHQCPADARFCRNCGERLEGYSELRSEPSSSSSASAPSSLNSFSAASSESTSASLGGRMHRRRQASSVLDRLRSRSRSRSGSHANPQDVNLRTVLQPLQGVIDSSTLPSDLSGIEAQRLHNLRSITTPPDHWMGTAPNTPADSDDALSEYDTEVLRPADDTELVPSFTGDAPQLPLDSARGTSSTSPSHLDSAIGTSSTRPAWMLPDSSTPAAAAPSAPESEAHYFVEVIRNGMVSSACDVCGEPFVVGQLKIGYMTCRLSVGSNARQYPQRSCEMWVHAPRCTQHARIVVNPSNSIAFNPFVPIWEQQRVLEELAANSQSRTLGSVSGVQHHRPWTYAQAAQHCWPVSRLEDQQAFTNATARRRDAEAWNRASSTPPVGINFSNLLNERLLRRMRSPSPRRTLSSTTGRTSEGVRRGITAYPNGEGAPLERSVLLRPISSHVVGGLRTGFIPGMTLPFTVPPPPPPLPPFLPNPRYLFGPPPPTDIPPPIPMPSAAASSIAVAAASLAALLAAVPVYQLTNREADPCVVCHEPMRAGQEVRRLPCFHVYHRSCIDRWLGVKPTCPLDNQKLEDLVREQQQMDAATEPASDLPPNFIY